MYSAVLTIAARFLLPLLLMASVYLLLRGHNEPGGGFAGGLVAAVAVALLLITAGLDSVRRLLPLEPLQLIGLGLLLAAISAAAALPTGSPFFEACWYPQEFSLLGGFHLGTPFLFDVGVYLVAAGTILLGLNSLKEDS